MKEVVFKNKNHRSVFYRFYFFLFWSVFFFLPIAALIFSSVEKLDPIGLPLFIICIIISLIYRLMNGYQVITYKDGEFKIRFGKTFNYNEIESIYVSHFPKEEVMIEFKDKKHTNITFNEKTINFDKLKEVIDLSENNKLVVINNKHKLVSDNVINKSNIYIKFDLFSTALVSLVVDNAHTINELEKYTILEVENGSHDIEIYGIDFKSNSDLENKLICSKKIDIQKDEYLLVHFPDGEDNPVIDISNEEELKKEDKEDKKEK